MSVRVLFVALLAACVATVTLFLGCSQPRDGATGTQPATTRFDLEETTVAALLQDQQSGRRTARQIAEQYLARIQALDRSGPSLHAVLEVNPDALAIADALDVERQAKGPRGPLHGVPVLIKDNIDTADRMSTSAGSLALEG